MQGTSGFNGFLRSPVLQGPATASAWPPSRARSFPGAAGEEPAAHGVFLVQQSFQRRTFMKDLSMLLLIGAIGATIGFYMGESSDEPAAAAVAAAPVAAVAEGAGHLPAGVVVQAKDVQPLPAKF
jgi:hypothetical protein